MFGGKVLPSRSIAAAWIKRLVNLSFELFISFSCLDSPPIPDIYLSFEKTVDGDSTKSPYDNGMDKNGNSQVTLVNGASIGTSTGRPGKVLRMIGSSAGANAGFFENHKLK